MIVTRTYTLKLYPNKSQTQKLNEYFYEAKILYNYLLSCSDVFAVHSWKIKHVWKFDRDRNKIKVELKSIPVLVRQQVHQQIKDSISSLKELKAKGFKVGHLKYKSEISTINLDNQCYKVKGKHKIRIVGFRKSCIKCRGLNQFDESVIKFRNAHLMKKCNSFFLKICISKIIPNHESTRNVIGIDFGIKDNFTLSDGRKLNCKVGETVRLKKLQRKFARSKRINGKNFRTNNQQKLLNKIHKEYQKMSNQKNDFINKFLHDLDINYDTIVFQDEQLKGWKNLKGNRNTIQHSCLGILKRKLIERAKEQPDRYIMHSRWLPTTQYCPRCHKKNKHNLDERTYNCSCGYSFDRDIHAARNMLIFARISD